MTQPAIRVHNLSKRYRIGAAEEKHDTFAAALAHNLRQPVENLRRLRNLTRFGANGHEPEDTIWALRDVSFEVQPGEVVGVIGRNGAGKSTLFKILSRITHPTSGRVELHGRVSSLLEVGTGFHPELTGRENVYLNGTILGMRKAEIDRKFDEIVDFSGVEKFIDTPVKRYSSGMKVRLAFSVAAHLEPEILLVDEVLAVGDAAFQSKSLGKMEDVARTGRTVLFVSHNMAAIDNLCPRSLLLDNGKLQVDSVTNNVLDHYVRITSTPVTVNQKNHNRVIQAVVLEDDRARPTTTFRVGEQISIVLHLEIHQTLEQPRIGIGINNLLGQRIATVATYLSTSTLPDLQGRSTVRCTLLSPNLAPGRYQLKIAVGTEMFGDVEIIENAIVVEIIPRDFYGNGRLPASNQGFILISSDWCLVSTSSTVQPSH